MQRAISNCSLTVLAVGLVFCQMLACGDSNSSDSEPSDAVVQIDDGRQRPDLAGFPDINDDPTLTDVLADPEVLANLDVDRETISDQGEETDSEIDLGAPDTARDPDLVPEIIEPGDSTDDESDLDLDRSWDSETACGPPNSDDPLPAVLDLRSTPRFLEIQVTFAVSRSEHIKNYDIYMDGEFAVEVGHEGGVSRLGGVVYDLASSVEHTFFVRAISDSCREGAASEEITASSVQHFALALQAGTASAGSTGSVDLLLTNSEPVTAVSFGIEDTPDWLTFTDATADGWSWDVTDDGSRGRFIGTASEEIPIGADQLIATIEVSAESGVSGMVRMTPGDVSVTGASSVVNTSDGRFTISP